PPRTGAAGPRAGRVPRRATLRTTLVAVLLAALAAVLLLVAVTTHVSLRAQLDAQLDAELSRSVERARGPGHGADPLGFLDAPGQGEFLLGAALEQGTAVRGAFRDEQGALQELGEADLAALTA